MMIRVLCTEDTTHAFFEESTKIPKHLLKDGDPVQVVSIDSARNFTNRLPREDGVWLAYEVDGDMPGFGKLKILGGSASVVRAMEMLSKEAIPADGWRDLLFDVSLLEHHGTPYDGSCCCMFSTPGSAIGCGVMFIKAFEDEEM